MVDAHHHLLDPAAREYPWMVGPAAALRRRCTVDELRHEAGAVGVDRTVLVQTVADLDETREFLAVADGSGGPVAGVVGWVDLTAPDLDETLAGLRAAPGGERLVGIRHQVHDEPDPDWLTRPDVLRGLATLAEHGLAYDLLVRVRELPAALRAARSLESLRFVVDHAAKPDIASGAVRPWADGMAELAALPNVTCKLSGLVTEASWRTWTVADLHPYVTELLESFGPARLLFGSDWPVCTLAATYSEVLDAARRCLSALSPAESAAVFGGNAIDVYRM
ncbi:amidohydrolase family protein [Halosaccharopolyspora lacisalsi]|uniref:amidohydrolase family protein n=1 Tax=Halosaccharopolyspora lacisalsi TaxID=1000566 RepID=UPI002E2E237D|nr:amidohydrolase family protein [Halosaccharopolyspora lacisalsi]